MSKFLHKLDSELQLIYKHYQNVQKLGRKKMDWIHPCLKENDPLPVIITTTANAHELEKYGFRLKESLGKTEFSGSIAVENLESIASLKETHFLKFNGEPAEIPQHKKIDPRTQIILDKAKKDKAFMASGDSGRQTKMLGALLQFRDSYEFLADLGCQVTSIVGTMVAVKIPLDRLEAVVSHPNVIRIETNRNYAPDLDDSIEEINADGIRNDSPPFGGTDKFTGKGVIVGIIDFGFLYSHKVFRDISDESKSRILFLMDQSLTPEGGETAPTDAVGNPMDGVEYDTQDIENAIAASDPMTVVRHEPDDHGTHVAGIAAGNGAQSGNCHGSFHYVGVAPEADLIFVRLRSGSNELGTSNNLIDAISYIMRKAEDADKPAVVNMSLGDNLGPHDGTTLVEEMIDLYLLLGNTKGFSIVKSAGNLGSDDRHAQTTVPANNAASPVELKFKVLPPKDDDDTKKIEIDIWYEGANDLDIEIIPKGNNITGTNTASPGDNVNFTEDTKNSTITIDSQNVQNNGRKRIFIDIDPDGDDHNKTGIWVIKLTNTTATDAAIHAYIERDQLAKFTTFETDEGTISIPGTAERVITVGNYIIKGKDSGKLKASSSQGPTADGRMKPEISAPGTRIMSARHDPDAGSCCDCCYDFYIAKSGTSMAAPHVAGAAALLFEKDPELHHDDLKQALMDTAVKDSFTGNTANNRFGDGKLDVQAAVNSIAAGIVMASNTFERERLQTFNTDPEPLFAKGSPISRLVKTPQGKELYDLALAHYKEIRDLVNTNKRVATAWHRNKGPLLVHHLNRASLLPHVEVPEKIEGRPVVGYLQNIVTELKKHVAGETAVALEIAMKQVPNFVGKTFNEFVASYEEIFNEPIL
ncbi:S8 family serine peptidase [Pricia sp. S334]|uniref:S8 family serine peptidase n=1 Tax=Pricia mediterranea TaxID=3076079 RepID=A0ABU3L383_9FLAO|nr:S8 family serine peptidase [Pricia sp. S334]MDT7827761.1 S8 family serine peptidase [Pricia sp. S334]